MKNILKLPLLFTLLLTSNAQAGYEKTNLDTLPIEITVVNFRGDLKKLDNDWVDTAVFMVGQPDVIPMTNKNEIMVVGSDLYDGFDHVEKDGKKLKKKAYLPKDSVDKERLVPFMKFINNSEHLAEELVGGKFRINKDGAPELELNNGQIINEQNIALALMMKNQMRKLEKAYIDAWDEHAPEIDRLQQVERDSKLVAKQAENLTQQLLMCEAKQEGMAEAISVLNVKPIQDLNRNGREVIAASGGSGGGPGQGGAKVIKARTIDSE